MKVTRRLGTSYNPRLNRTLSKTLQWKGGQETGVGLEYTQPFLLLTQAPKSHLASLETSSASLCRNPYPWIPHKCQKG